jgi:surfeit locus 1 family protein
VKRLWPLLLATTIGLVILCSLGTWQIFRLAEKTKLIEQLEARMDAPAISLADAMARQAKGEDVEYMMVRAGGALLPAHTLAKISSFKGDPGWEIIVPFMSTDGIFVLMDIGPSATKQIPAPNLLGPQVDAIIRLHKKGRGFFDNDNDEAGNTWYWWDLPAMWAAAQAPPDAKIARFVLQIPEYMNDPSTMVHDHPAQVELNNNHLGYALTWFGLAAALVAVAGFFGRSILLDPNKRQG